MNAKQFSELVGQGYNRIPLMAEVLADLDTPLSTYLKLANSPYTYLFESVLGGETWGRYSIIGLPSHHIIRITGQTIHITKHGVEQQLHVDDPLAWIEEFRSQFHVPSVPGLPRFTGGLVGYFGYDTVRYIEPCLATCPQTDPIKTPDILLMVSDEVVVFDNLLGKLYIVVHVDARKEGAYHEGRRRLRELIDRLRQATPACVHVAVPQQIHESDFVSDFSRIEFEAAVNRIKEYILAGDVMQVVLSQRLSIPFRAPPLDLYRALRTLNPSPYMYFMNIGDSHIVGSSPEILTRVENDVVTLRPIAGTRPRGRNQEEDLALERDLLADPKELAEHLMLIDLGRNDVGRVSEVGSVQLTDKMVIERYSHVMHIVSNVTGRLKKGFSVLDVLRATFPAGTVSGAPKIRAMEILDELEPVKRGIYAGAVGYIGWSGNMDIAIAIRTAVIKNGKLHIQAGAGVVADSVPAQEWEETMNKGRAMFKAVAIAEAGLEAPQF